MCNLQYVVFYEFIIFYCSGYAIPLIHICSHLVYVRSVEILHVSNCHMLENHCSIGLST